MITPQLLADGALSNAQCYGNLCLAVSCFTHAINYVTILLAEPTVGFLLHIGLCKPPCLNFLLCFAHFFYSLDVCIRRRIIRYKKVKFLKRVAQWLDINVLAAQMAFHFNMSFLRCSLGAACLVLVSCVTPIEPQVSEFDERTDRIVGYVEHIRVVPEDILLNSRMDTGATTSSINAQNISEFERDGSRWVRFEIEDEANEETIVVERAVARTVRIRQHSGEADERFVVVLEILLGNRHLKGEFTLADRDQFNYKGLLGRNLLGEGYLVDSRSTSRLGQPRQPNSSNANRNSSGE